jgi:hypothetical protein
LVIDTISCYLVLPVGQRPLQLILVFDTSWVAWIPLTLTGSATPSSYFSGVERVQLYANPGTVVTMLFTRNATSGAGHDECAISGHYVPV